MLRIETLQQQIVDNAAAAAKQAAAVKATGRLMQAPRGSGAPSAAAMQQELVSMANLLAGLLAGVPGQMNGQFVEDLLGFITQTLIWLDKQG